MNEQKIFLKVSVISALKSSVMSGEQTSLLLVNLMSPRPDGIGTVTVEEKERFDEIKERLRVLLENQITHFR